MERFVKASSGPLRHYGGAPCNPPCLRELSTWKTQNSKQSQRKTLAVLWLLSKSCPSYSSILSKKIGENSFHPVIRSSLLTLLSRETYAEELEKFKLALAMKCLLSSNLEKRLYGINTVTTLINMAQRRDENKAKGPSNYKYFCCQISLIFILIH